MNIILVGSNGKMGKMVSSLAKSQNSKIIAKIDKNGKKIKNFSEISPKIIKLADIVIDFALPDVLESELNFCIKNNKKLLICSTGHTPAQEQKIISASKKIPIFKTANTSLGIALIKNLLNTYNKILSKYEIAIIDKHHSQKKDSPSGTAKLFAHELQTHGIQTSTHSIRAGTCIGEHQILLFNDFEQLTITHTAESRQLFASNALKICSYLATLPPGLYSMDDYLEYLLERTTKTII